MSLREPRATNQCPPPIIDPSSQDYHLHLQGEPEALVGRTLIARAYKFTDEGESAVYKTDTVLGKVYDYDGECYHVKGKEAGVERRISASSVISLIRTNAWWAE